MKVNKLKLYYYPSASKGGYSNPYSIRVKEAMGKFYDVLDSENTPCSALSLGILKNCTKADVFLLNWIENIGGAKLRYLQFLVVCLSFWIIRLRDAKILWTLHKIQPHEGDCWISQSIRSYLFKHADLIICHSMDAANYAKRNAHCEVIYICHPLEKISAEKDDNVYSTIDILIWGKILPYKGVAELLESDVIKNSDLKIAIIGKCDDVNLLEKIQSAVTPNVVFENRKIDFPELKSRIKSSKFVLFPYVGGSISSSGALMDTIVLGGIPLGPCMGAFKDLTHEGICLTYNTYEDIINLVRSNQQVDEKRRNDFIRRNSWSHFAGILQSKSIIYKNHL